MSTITNLNPWGYHAILDCSGCNVDAIKNESTIKAWIAELVPLVASSTIGESVVATTGKNNPDIEGLAVIQLLDIGSISANFVNESKHAYIDIFTCKEFLVSEIEAITKKHFGDAININKILLPRNAGITAP